MSKTHTRIDQSKHIKMKELSKLSGRTIEEEYDYAIEKYIASKKQEILESDTKLEQFINERFNKMENHLASMLGRTGMDVSMTLMGLILFLEKYFKTERSELQEILRKDGARYFVNAIQTDKRKTKESE